MNSPKWKMYQVEVAEFFQKLGFKSLVEHKVEGVRGIHEIDVYVEGDVYGISFIWIIECKAWNTNIPKEKVLALLSIVHDVGADRGFLLSEKGFQCGAKQVAKTSNIKLSSLADLNQTLQTDFIVGKLSWRQQKAIIRLRKAKKDLFNDDYPSPLLSIIGELVILGSVLEDALQNEYPFIYQGDFKVHSLGELSKIADELLNRAENYKP